jgi:membrane protein implicated in regulation of membrane protease activity
VPAWLYFVVWLGLSVLFALGVGRWFKFLQDEDAEERRNARDWHG